MQRTLLATLLLLARSTVRHGAVAEPVDRRVLANNSCDATRLAEQPLSFTHVPKAGGASWIRDLKRQVPNFIPMREHGREHCSGYDIARLPEACHLISLRSPRAHIWSEFRECVFSPWGRMTTKGQNFPSGGATVDDDFRSWLRVFQTEPSTPCADNEDYCYAFKCYSPPNFLSRHLTCARWDGHTLRAPNETVPDLALARDVLDTYAFVGIVDFNPQSWCLMHSRLKMPMPKACDCRSAAHAEVAKLTSHETHGADEAQGKVREMPHMHGTTDFDADILEMIDHITGVDREIFHYGLRRFFREVKAAEAKENIRLVCSEALEAKQDELRYVAPSLQQLYDEA